MAQKEQLTFLDGAVWDAIQNSRCPASHRYQGPGGSLPCRWCRAAHVLMLAFGRIETGEARAAQMILEFQEQLGWTFASPVVGKKPPFAPLEEKPKAGS
jgi:hypothetical protein